MKLFPKNVHEEGNKFQFGSFIGDHEALSDLFNLEFISENVFFFQMQIKSCITSFGRNVPATASQMPSKVYNIIITYMGKKPWQLFGRLCAKIVIINSNQWVKNHHFHLNCPPFGE